MKIRVSNRISSKEAQTTNCNATSPPVSAINKITAPILPGPAISGVARGNTAISGLRSASWTSATVAEVAPDGRAKAISMPISISKIPPAVCRAAKDMPRLVRTNSPKTATINKIIVANKTPRSAMDRRSLNVDDAVSAANTAATSIGPTVAKKVARATPAVSHMVTLAPPASLCYPDRSTSTRLWVFWDRRRSTFDGPKKTFSEPSRCAAQLASPITSLKDSTRLLSSARNRGCEIRWQQWRRSTQIRQPGHDIPKTANLNYLYSK